MPHAWGSSWLLQTEKAFASQGLSADNLGYICTNKLLHMVPSSKPGDGTRK